MQKYVIAETDQKKMLMSPSANYIFNKHTGDMVTWGASPEEDAVRFPAPTILDFEVTTRCTGLGKNNILCPFCYKANSPDGRNLSFTNFRTIFDKLPKSITQIAFGADSKCTTNPELFRMMQYAKDKGVIPNITAADVTDEVADKLASLCGAVAISRYHDANICYDSVKRLTDRGMKQVNIHMMIADETYERAARTVMDAATDPRLKGLNAIVFLSLKTKGRGVGFTPLSQERFNALVALCKDKAINYGFDSCSSKKFFDSLSNEEYDNLARYIQPCESTLESSYINVDGEFFPCSFTEGTKGWETGISVLDCEDFVTDVWENPRVEAFREKLLGTVCGNKFGCRECPIYKI